MLHAQLSRRIGFLFLLVSLILGLGTAAVAQKGKSDSTIDQPTPPSAEGQQTKEVDPLKRPLSDKQHKENAKSLKQEFGKTYKKWLGRGRALDHHR